MSTTRADDLVPIPRGGRVFAMAMRPGLADCAPNGRMRLDAMARWFQDIAWADINDAGVGDGAFWILRRSRIRVRRFPEINVPYAVRTFCSGVGRLVAERRTIIASEDGEEDLVDAASLWVHLDPDTHRPLHLTPEELAAFAASGYGERRVSHRLTHPRPEPSAATPLFDWHFRRVDTDLADHVNNSAYWELVEEELLSGSAGEPAALDVEIEFRDGAQPGPALYLAEDSRRCILGAGGKLLATIELVGAASGAGG